MVKRALVALAFVACNSSSPAQTQNQNAQTQKQNAQTQSQTQKQNAQTQPAQPTSRLPDAVPGFSAGPLTDEHAFARRTYTRGATHVTVTVAETPMTAAQFDAWVQASAAFPQAKLDAPADRANGFYQCEGERCDLLIQLRSGAHYELRSDGTATRADVDAIARALDLRARANETRVSFRRDIAPVFEHNCTAEGCHGDRGTHKVKLDLRAASAIATLRDQPCRDRPGWVLIAPGRPAQSFLVDKLLGHLHGNEGAPMPLDPDTGLPRRGALDSWVQQSLIPWIAGGANDD